MAKTGEGRYLKDAGGFLYGWNFDMALNRDLYIECDKDGNPLPEDQRLQVYPNMVASDRQALPTEPAQGLVSYSKPPAPTVPVPPPAAIR